MGVGVVVESGSKPSADSESGLVRETHSRTGWVTKCTLRRGREKGGG